MLLPAAADFALIGTFITVALAATLSGASSKPSGTASFTIASSKSSSSFSPSSFISGAIATPGASSSVKPSSSNGISSSTSLPPSFSTSTKTASSALPPSSAIPSSSVTRVSSALVSPSSILSTTLSNNKSLPSLSTTSSSTTSSSITSSTTTSSSIPFSSIPSPSATPSTITALSTSAPLTSKPSTSLSATKTTSTSTGSLTTTVSGGATIVVAAGVFVVGGPGGGTIIVNGVASTIAAGATEIAGEPNSESNPNTSKDLTTTTSSTSSLPTSSPSTTSSSTSSSASPTSSCLLYQDPGYPTPDDGDTQAGLGDFKRSLAGRIPIPDSRPNLEKRRGSFTVFSNPGGLSCTISATISQPSYPGPGAITKMEALPSGNPGRNEALFQTAKFWLVGRQDCGALPSFTSVDTQALPTAGSNGVPVAVGGRISPLVNVDHVWEMKFLNDFLGSQLSSSSFDCNDLNAVFMANDQARPTSATSQPRLQSIFDQLPGNQFPDFAGMLASTNNIKGTIFTPGGLKALKPKNSLLNTQTAALFTLQDIFIAFSMCNDPGVAQLFRNTNTRIFEALQGIDDVITNGCFTRQANGAPISATFASAFSTFMDQRISTANSEAFAFATSLASGSLAKATGTDAMAIARFTNSPLFTASSFAFNFNLGYTGTTPLKMRSLFNRAEACSARSSSSTLTTQPPASSIPSSSNPSTTQLPASTTVSSSTTVNATSAPTACSNSIAGKTTNDCCAQSGSCLDCQYTANTTAFPDCSNCLGVTVKDGIQTCTYCFCGCPPSPELITNVPAC